MKLTKNYRMYAVDYHTSKSTAKKRDDGRYIGSKNKQKKIKSAAQPVTPFSCPTYSLAIKR